MKAPKEAITEIVNRETRAWDAKDVSLLLTIFHPDMVWVWPKSNSSHNPIHWKTPLGKFEKKRWKKIYSDFFQKWNLVYNKRKIIKIEISKDRHGAYAVVDVDTLWINKKGKNNHWLGRACKIYS